MWISVKGILVEKRNILQEVILLQVVLNSTQRTLDPEEIAMGVYFLRDLSQAQKPDFQCLFCEASLESRLVLNQHYLAKHAEAFTDEELVMARSRRTQLSDAQSS